MKKYILVCLLASTAMVAFANNKPTAKKQYVIINGTFKLTGNIQTPRMMSVVLEPGNWSFNVFVENAP